MAFGPTCGWPATRRRCLSFRWIAFFVVVAFAACADDLMLAGDPPSPLPPEAQPPNLVVAADLLADSSRSYVEDPPGWREVILDMEYQECVVYWRRANGLYSLEVVEIAFSDEALSGPDRAIQVKTLRRRVPGTEEEYRIGIQATCLFPYTEAGRDELLTHLAAMFPLSVPAADVGAGTTSTDQDGSGQVQGDGDDPVPCTDTDGDGVFECPELTVTVDQEPDCADGFSYDEWEGECVEDEGDGTGDPGTGGGGGNSGGGGGGGGKDPPPPECTQDQLAIAAEYRTHGFSVEEWPCTVFTHGVTHGDGTHDHTAGYLTDDFLAGSAEVFSTVEAAGVSGPFPTSDWRCPVGNAHPDVGGSPGSQHVLGTAGDFTAAGFDSAMHIVFERAAGAASAAWSSGYGTGKNEYNSHIHIDWRVYGMSATRITTGVVIGRALVTIAAPSTAVAVEAQDRTRMTELEAAAVLQDNRVTPERDQALQLAMRLGPSAGPQLRSALIDAAWAELNGEIDRPPGSEAVFDYVIAVAGLRDIEALPFLLESPLYGAGLTNAIADLGLAAFPALLAAATDSAESSGRVAEWLEVLRFMLEDGTLGAAELARTREVARGRLSAEQEFVVLLSAQHLAVALGDAELRRIVERIATDRAFTEGLMPIIPEEARSARALKHRSWEVDEIQKDARALLSGATLPPHRWPFRGR